MELLFKVERELRSLGFDVQLGTDEEGTTGIIELKVRKRKPAFPDLLQMQFDGFKHGFSVYLDRLGKLVVRSSSGKRNRRKGSTSRPNP